MKMKSSHFDEKITGEDGIYGRGAFFIEHAGSGFIDGFAASIQRDYKMMPRIEMAG